jgi:hypothetical protein
MERVHISMLRLILNLPWSAKSAAVRLITGRPTLEIAREVAVGKFLRRASRLPRSRLVRIICDKGGLEFSH